MRKTGSEHPPRPSRRNGQRGASAVEFAIILPLLLLLVFGSIDFGWLVNRQTTINNAAREGAREGIFNPDSAAIEARVRAAAETLDQSQLTVTVTCRKEDGTNCPGVSFDSEWEPGGTVIVRVSYEHAFLTPAPRLIGTDATRTVSSTLEMRIEA